MPSVKFGGGGTMVWCCFLGVGLGPLVPVKGTLNVSAYQEHTKKHDCAPLQKARPIKTWMSKFSMEELDWPAQSPDLTNALLEEWSKIHINTLLYLVKSLPRRVQAAKGGPTSY